MATIEKRGNSYRIVVSLGYDANGKRIRRRMEWQPRQIEKELNRQAVAFEDKINY